MLRSGLRSGLLPGLRSGLSSDLVAFLGHRVHVCRCREVGTLFRWLGDDLAGLRVLDVAGGDGYWAGRLKRRGAFAVSVDLSRRKMRYGARLKHAPYLLQADAGRLPFPDASFDAVLSVCSLEHFDDGPRALDEMARVLRPDGSLVLSADALTRAARWPGLFAAHRNRYQVRHTYTHDQLVDLLAGRGFEVLRHTYQFRTRAAERMYLGLARYGGPVGPNAAAVLTPLVALSDRHAPNDRGSVVLVHARRRA